MFTKAMCKQPREQAIPANNLIDIFGRGTKSAKGAIKKNLKKLKKRGGKSKRPILLKVVLAPMIAIAKIAKNIFLKDII
jgi:hypothetical protein